MPTYTPSRDYLVSPESLLHTLQPSGIPISLPTNVRILTYAPRKPLQESFLEDINNILNSGEVPNLMVNDDLEQVGTRVCVCVCM